MDLSIDFSGLDDLMGFNGVIFPPAISSTPNQNGGVDSLVFDDGEDGLTPSPPSGERIYSNQPLTMPPQLQGAADSGNSSSLLPNNKPLEPPANLSIPISRPIPMPDSIAWSGGPVVTSTALPQQPNMPAGVSHNQMLLLQQQAQIRMMQQHQQQQQMQQQQMQQQQRFLQMQRMQNAQNQDTTLSAAAANTTNTITTSSNTTSNTITTPTTTPAARRPPTVGTWQSEADLPQRRKMIARIATLLQQRKPDAPPEWTKKLPDMARRLEDSLYRTAQSVNEYGDFATLKQRLQSLAMNMGNVGQNPVTKTTRSDEPLAMPPELAGEESSKSFVNANDINPSLGKPQPTAQTNEEKQQSQPQQQPQQQRSTSLSNPAERQNILRQQQQRLLLLRHASKCPAPEGTCHATPHCSAMKKLWTHIASCKDPNCTVNHCVSSRYVLSHYHRCKDITCGVCGPVREAIKKHHDNAKTPNPVGSGSSVANAAPITNAPLPNATASVPAQSLSKKDALQQQALQAFEAKAAGFSQQQLIQHMQATRASAQQAISLAQSLAQKAQMAIQAANAAPPLERPQRTAEANQAKAQAITARQKVQQLQIQFQALAQIVKKKQAQQQNHQLGQPSSVVNSTQSTPTPTLSATEEPPLKKMKSEFGSTNKTLSQAPLLPLVSNTPLDMPPELSLEIGGGGNSQSKPMPLSSTSSFLPQSTTTTTTTTSSNNSSSSKNNSSKNTSSSKNNSSKINSSTTALIPAANKPNKTTKEKKKGAGTSTVSTAAAAVSATAVSAAAQPARAVGTKPPSSTGTKKQTSSSSNAAAAAATAKSLEISPSKVSSSSSAAAAAAAALSTRPKYTKEGTSMLSQFSTELIQAHLHGLRKDFCCSNTASQLKTRLQTILKVLMDHEFGWVFNTPVDPVALGIPDYFSIVQRPMDLGTVRKRLEAGAYKHPDLFANQVRLTFENAMLYNEENSDVYTLARDMLSQFNTAYDAFRSQLEKEEDEKRKSETACRLCGGERFSFEPLVFYCNGPCALRIRRNSYYYTTAENKYHWCQPCYNDLKAGAEVTAGEKTLKKSELMKKKHDEVREEPWVQCDHCERWVHQLCSLFNGRNMEAKSAKANDKWYCAECIIELRKSDPKKVPIQPRALGAKDLATTKLTDYIENRVRKVLLEEQEKDKRQRKAAGKPVEGESLTINKLCIRQVSNIEKSLPVRNNMLARYKESHSYTSEFRYKSKCLIMFQELDGVDVLLFGMYVHEFDEKEPEPNSRRVYISYLDSVQYFQPRHIRTVVYHEILLAYLNFVKKRGFHTAHIWACPPLKGDDYILYCHPEDQRTPKSERLRVWYITMLIEAQKQGIVTELTNFYSEYWKEGNAATVLPYFEGDYWVGIAEEFIENINEEENNKKKKGKKEGTEEGDGSRSNSSKSKHKNPNKKSKGEASTSITKLNEDKMDPLMVKLGTVIEPMKDDFIVVRLQFQCHKCSKMILKGNRWKDPFSETSIGLNPESKEYNICDPCYQILRAAKNGREKGGLIATEDDEISALVPVKVSIPEECKDPDETMECEFFDTRQAFLSLCQGNHYQFDELRRAKHTSMMVLYHLHNPTAPAYIYVCNHCQNDIVSGHRWHCDVCSDFDVCEPCKLKLNHAHPLKPISVTANKEDEAKSRKQREERKRSIQLHMQLLVHSSGCSNPSCLSPNCLKMKALLKHGATCKLRATGGCHVCRRIWALLQIHARQCRLDACAVPRCADLKEHLRRLQQQQQQMDDRRRAAVTQHYRGQNNNNDNNNNNNNNDSNNDSGRVETVVVEGGGGGSSGGKETTKALLVPTDSKEEEVNATTTTTALLTTSTHAQIMHKGGGHHHHNNKAALLPH